MSKSKIIEEEKASELTSSLTRSLESKSSAKSIK